jgi:hypothetical protein
MIPTYTRRPEADLDREQSFLQRTALEIEKAMGKVAARQDRPTPITQPLDALDRARELVNHLYKQVRMRSLEDALAAQLDWLDRAEAKAALADGEPKIAYSKIALDRRLLADLQERWRASKK